MAAMLKSAAATRATVRVAPKANKMMVWQPTNNKFFETFSFLPPLSSDQIARQVDYIVNNGWTPCLEISDADSAYTSNDNCVRLNGCTPGYYDNRYWTMYKLPMFGCTDASQVLREVANATRSFPDCYVRMAAFDASRQVQVAAMLVHRPPTVKDFRAANDRSC